MSDLQCDVWGKLLVRLTVGSLMLFHGVAKILHPGSLDFIGGSLTNAGLPAELVWGVYVGEVVAPLMVIAGVHARVGGAIMVVNMLFAIGLVHAGDIFALTQHGGWAIELQMFYLLGALAVVMLGSGRLAVKPD